MDATPRIRPLLAMTATNEFFPDRVIAIGNAGIECALSTLRQEWLLKEILRPRPERSEEVLVQCIDTALSERNDREAEISEIRTKIDEVREEVRDPTVGQVGTIDIELEVLTENITLESSLDMVGPSNVEDICRKHGMSEDDYWLEYNDFDESLDYAEGVHRQRALSKGVYYKSLTVNRELENVFDMPNKGQVAIVTGIGGGTGSGMAIDVARTIIDASPVSDVTLFGVLPSAGEGDDVMANAYACLSELEYLKFSQRRDLFQDIVLLPIDSTGYEGKRGDDLETDDNLREFDQAFPYVLTAYYNYTEEDAFNSTPQCGPFTVAIPQVLRYNFDGAYRERERLSDAIESLNTATEAGDEVYTHVLEFLHTEFETPETELPGKYRDNLEMALEDLQRLVNSHLFEEIEFATVDRFSDIYTEADEDTETVAQLVRQLDARAMGLTHDIEFENDLDRQLANAVQAGLDHLDTRLEVFRNLAGIDDDLIERALFALLTTDSNVGLKQRRVESKRDDYRAEVEDLNAKLQQLKERLETQEAEIESKRQRKLKTWLDRTATDRSILATAATTDIETHLESVEQALRAYARQVQRAESTADLAELDDDAVRSAFDDLERVLEQADVGPEADPGFVGREDILTSLEKLRNVREASFDVDQDVNTVLSKLPWETAPEEAIKDAEQRRRRLKGQLERSSVFKVRADSADHFSVDVTYDCDEQATAFDDHIDEHVTAAVTELSNLVETPLVSIETELRNALKRDDDVESVVKDVIRQDLPGDQSLRQDLDAVESDLTSQQTARNRYDATVTLFETLVDEEGVQLAFDSAWQDLRQRTQAASELTGDAEDDYYYIRRVSPQEPILGAEMTDLTDTDVLQSNEERLLLQQRLKDQTESMLKPDYHGLEKRRFSDGTTSYDGLKINLGVMCRGVADIQGEFGAVKDKLTGAFGLHANNKNYGTWKVDTAGPWDVAMTLFIDGVFLDALRNVTVYREGYIEGDLDHDRHMCHALGLDEGWYVNRADVVNVNDLDELTLYTSNHHGDDTIVDTLTTEYIETVEMANWSVGGPEDDETGLYTGGDSL